MVDALVEQFRERAALGGVRHPARAEAAAQHDANADAVDRLAAAGRHGLELFATRTGATDSRLLSAGLLVLALLPEALCDESGQPAPADLASFATTVLGRDVDARLDVRPDLLPPGLSRTVETIQRLAATSPEPRADEAPRSVMRLAILALGYGVTHREALPPWTTVGAWARAAGWSWRTQRDWYRGLRRASELASGALAQILDAGRTPDDSAALRVREVVDLLHDVEQVQERPVAVRTLAVALARAGITLSTGTSGAESAGNVDAALKGLRLPRAERAMLARIGAFAPSFALLVTAPRLVGRSRRRPRLLRPATARKLIRAIDRLLAQLVDLGYDAERLRETTPTCLLRERADASLLTVPPLALAGHDWLRANLGQPVAAPTVPLLHLLLDRQAPASARRSPVQRIALGSSGGADARSAEPVADRPAALPVRYTQTLIADARLFAHAFRRVAHTTTAVGSEERQALDAWCVVAADVETQLRIGATMASDQPEVKRVARLMELVTWPQLCCVGLPLLRARLHHMRSALRSRPQFGVTTATDWETYADALESYLVIAILCADPVRLKHLCYALIGGELHVSVDDATTCGAIVAVYSEYTGEGGSNPSAAFKVSTQRSHTSRRGEGAERSRTHDWSPGQIDFVLLHDYLASVRAPRMRDLLGDPTYTLAADLRGEYAARPLFLTTRTSPEERTQLGGLGEGALRSRFARALHWVCRDALGRALPSWDEFSSDRGTEWFALFAPHVVRSLAATYWLWVRERRRVGDALSPETRAALREMPGHPCILRFLEGRTWAYATHLLGDHERTLRRSYVVCPAWMKAALRAPARGWEHPRAYDVQMDLLACGAGIDWPSQQGMPLPPHLCLQDLAA